MDTVINLIESINFDYETQNLIDADENDNQDLFGRLKIITSNEKIFYF